MNCQLQSKYIFLNFLGKHYQGNQFSRFDLRFIPDDMSFDDEPKEFCDQLPDPSTYKPKVHLKLIADNFLLLNRGLIRVTIYLVFHNDCFKTRQG